MPPHRCRRCEAAPRRSKPLEAASPLPHSSFHPEAPRGARAFPRRAPPPLRFPVAGVDPLLRGPHRSKPHEVAQSSLITVEPAALNPSARPLHRARRSQSLEAALALAARRPAAVLDSKPRHPRPIRLKPRHPRPILSKPRHPRPIRPKPRHPRPVLSKPLHPRPIRPKPRHPRPVLSKPRHPRPIRPKPRHPRPIRRYPCRAAAHDSARDFGRSVDARAPSSTLMARTRGAPSDAASLHLEGRSPVNAAPLSWPFTTAERRRHGPPPSRSQIRGSTVRSQPQRSSVINKARQLLGGEPERESGALLSNETARQVFDSDPERESGALLLNGFRPPSARCTRSPPTNRSTANLRERAVLSSQTTANSRERERAVLSSQMKLDPLAKCSTANLRERAVLSSQTKPPAKYSTTNPRERAVLSSQIKFAR
uniref:Uncharacterized protein n=1 Tax=Ananas comosus var. bracteatus TaxID=296719 RepID=A0A6V7PEK6_ANACO|nr:unnamed protein product [Ananas comosus var. bracteatus]